MDGMQEILFRLDAIEVLGVKVAGTVSILAFCFYMTWSHIRGLHNSKQKRRRKDSHKNKSRQTHNIER
jgi:hypothetical protein